MKPEGAGSLGDFAKALASPRAKRRARAADKVAEAWAAVAGEDLARATRVTSVREGVACVATPSASLCHELAGFRREALLSALNVKLAEGRTAPLRSLIFRTGSV
jgi:predicted nucleic acid-binding Zn ribbon protein